MIAKLGNFSLSQLLTRLWLQQYANKKPTEANQLSSHQTTEILRQQVYYVRSSLNGLEW